MRSVTRAIVCFLVLAVPVLFPQTAGAGEERLVTIGAAPLGGTYYPAAIALGEIIKKYVPGVDARVEVTGGTVENPALMQMGELQFGLANADMAYFAYYGMEPFPTRLTDIRALFTGLAPGVVQYAVMDASGIRSVRDLKGKRVAVGPQGNSSGLLFFKVLELYGLTATDVTCSYLSFSDGVGELLDGHVDMAIVQAGLPAPGLMEAFAGVRGVRILSFTPEERAAFLKQYPYYVAVDIPRTTYPKMAEDAATIATRNMVLVHADLPEELVYRVTRAVFEHLEVLREAHPSMRSVSLETASGAPIPLHPGAARYFREQGEKFSR